jgi:hypothetical protein
MLNVNACVTLESEPERYAPARLLPENSMPSYITNTPACFERLLNNPEQRKSQDALALVAGQTHLKKVYKLEA